MASVAMRDYEKVYFMEILYFLKKNIQYHTATGCDSQPCGHLNESNQETFDSTDFHLSRFARILPVYYFCIIVGAILIPFGHSFSRPGDLWFNVGGSVLSLFLLQTWVLVFGFGPNGPSWTVSTLFFFYLVYPRYIRSILYRQFFSEVLMVFASTACTIFGPKVWLDLEIVEDSKKRIFTCIYPPQLLMVCMYV